MSDATGNNSRMSRRILRQIAPFWRQIALLLLVDLLATPLLLLTPIPLKIAIDTVIDSHPLPGFVDAFLPASRSEEHTSELQSRPHLVCRLLLEKKKKHRAIPLHLVQKKNTKKE